MQKMRIAVLFGGKSHEKEISLESGRNVFYKLSPDKYAPMPIFVSINLELYVLTQSQLVRNSTIEISELLQESQKIKWSDLPIMFDFIFNALHGGEGENGSVQGALEILGIPYNGSSVFTSALCMNKYKTNQLLALHGFDVPKHIYMTKKEWETHSTILQYTHTEYLGQAIEDETSKNMLYEEQKEDIPSSFVLSFLQRVALHNVSKDVPELSYPLIIKPHDDGCSVMVQKVSNDEECLSALEKIFVEKDAVLIEECITGMELTVGVIGNDSPRVLPPSQAISTQGILSVEEKFLPGAGENQTPAPLSQEALICVQKIIEAVYITVQCKGYARIDCFYQNQQESPTGKERVVILEINTLPGLTPATCLFHQAAEIGLKPMDLIDTIVILGIEEHTPYEERVVPTNTQLLKNNKEFYE